MYFIIKSRHSILFILEHVNSKQNIIKLIFLVVDWYISSYLFHLLLIHIWNEVQFNYFGWGADRLFSCHLLCFQDSEEHGPWLGQGHHQSPEYLCWLPDHTLLQVIHVLFPFTFLWNLSYKITLRKWRRNFDQNQLLGRTCSLWIFTYLRIVYGIYLASHSH